MKLAFNSINKKTDVTQFSCTEQALNDYFRKHALTNHINKVATCIVVSNESSTVGYFCWSSCAVDKTSIAPHDAKGLPRYPLPAIKIGRIAVDSKHTGRGMGGLILRYIFDKAIEYSNDSEYPAFSFLLVDAKSSRSAEWYLSYGFKTFVDKHDSLYLPIKTLLKAKK